MGEGGGGREREKVCVGGGVGGVVSRRQIKHGDLRCEGDFEGVSAFSLRHQIVTGALETLQQSPTIGSEHRN